MNSFDMSMRRSRAQTAIGALVAANADRALLVSILRATPAQSADDRPDDLCAVYVRGPLTGADVSRVEGRDDAFVNRLRAFLGASYDRAQPWQHSWTRRRVSRNGVEQILTRDAWLEENATCILRSGGVEVKAYGGEWVRIAAEADYPTAAPASAESEAAA